MMGEKYIFKWANDSINEVFKPLWLNDTTYHLSNHINAEVSWYETLDLSTKISLISLVISILTFFAGFIISEFIRRHNKSHNLKQYKQFINEWVEKSNATLIDYINSLETFSNKIKTNTDLNIAPWRSGIIHLSEINKIPLEKFSDIYIFGLSKKIENENRKQIMNFLYQIEYLIKHQL